MYCKNCGRKLDDGERICPVCGHSNIKTSELNAIANYGSYHDDYNFWYAMLCFLHHMWAWFYTLYGTTHFL